MIVDEMEVLMMQNWDHVITTLGNIIFDFLKAACQYVMLSANKKEDNFLMKIS